jgi:peroxiredoxin
MDPLRPGDAAPDFTVQLADGKTLQLSDFRGRPLVLIFTRHLA